MTASTAKPIVLVPACNQLLGEHPFHIAGQKYVDAVRLAGCTPLIVPTAELAEIPALLALADGVLLTGSPSNVHPSHFGETVFDPSLPLDPARDFWTLPLIRQALAMGLPLFGICRGTQETNVALGGTLHQAVQEAGPFQDHRSVSGQPAAQQYAAVHPVQVLPGGRLAQIVDRSSFAGELAAWPGGQAVGAGPAGGSAGAGWPGRGVFGRDGAWLQPLRAMAPGMAGRLQPGVDATAGRLRRRGAGLARSPPASAAAPAPQPDPLAPLPAPRSRCPGRAPSVPCRH